MVNLSEFLYDLNQALQVRGIQTMNREKNPHADETIQEVALRLTSSFVRPHVESGEWTVQHFVDEIEHGLRGFREQQMNHSRSSLISATSKSDSRGLPFGGSRLADEPNLMLGDSLLHNLPAEPTEQTIQHPIFRGLAPNQFQLEMT